MLPRTCQMLPSFVSVPSLPGVYVSWFQHISLDFNIFRLSNNPNSFWLQFRTENMGENGFPSTQNHCFALREPKELRRKRHKLTLEPGRKTLPPETLGRKNVFGGLEFQQCDFWWFLMILGTTTVPFHFWCFWAIFHDFGVLQPLHIWCFWAIFDDFGVLLPLHFLRFWAIFDDFGVLLPLHFWCFWVIFWFWGGRSVVSSLKWALLTERLWNWVHKTQQH
jgi:hypothetical protein